MRIGRWLQHGPRRRPGEDDVREGRRGGVPGPSREEIRALLARIDEAWRSGRVEDLRECFHEHAVIAHPGLGARTEGREACVASYEDFVRRARVTSYGRSEASIDVVGDAAVATYTYEIAWEMDGASHREPGRDLFVLVRQDGRWHAAWRTLLPADAGEGGPP